MIGFNTNDTICAPATAPGISAIAIIRVSGPDCSKVVSQCFKPSGKKKSFETIKPRYATLGEMVDGDKIIDEVLLTKFKAPSSYTGEDLVEISCHGSFYIQQQLLELLIKKGARPASPGEFTLRAFLNGKLDLSQAEAVADLIASNSEASHSIAMNQMRGHFSKKIKDLRAQLLNFASLIELELDFSEEDVEFADRLKLTQLLDQILQEVCTLTGSFSLGNVLKNGIPVAIVGKPNVGKSTLLNALLNEERAIVSEIPGTTRDAIEDTLSIGGVTFRFIDTAGLRRTTDKIETLGIERTLDKINKAAIVLYIFDAAKTNFNKVVARINELRQNHANHDKPFILIANKIDLLEEMPPNFSEMVEFETIFVSAKRKENIHLITDSLLAHVNLKMTEEGQTLVANTRHYEALLSTSKALEETKSGLQNNIPGDLLASDLRTALYHLGTISGEVTSDEILGNIFVNFCIGK